jgi:septum site-determining protein MinC
LSASDVESEIESENTDRIDLHPPGSDAAEQAATDDEGEPETESDDEEDDDDAGGEVELFGTETMAELHARQGRLGEAIAIFKRLIERDPQAERHPQWVERCRSLERARAHTGDLEILSETPAPPPPPPAQKPVTGEAAAPPADAPAAAPAPAPEPPPPSEHRLPLIINQPVRSGQVVYARGRDLIVIGSVNPGGQVVADGHIHVYGTLRGRAVAGAQGCAEARIFCQRLEAELLAINGIYLVFDDLPPGCLGKPAQIEVQGGQCLVKAL